MKAADSPLIVGGVKRRVSSPPGIFSTLTTSAPMSASSIPQVGPDMMCASSITRRPASGPSIICRSSSTPSPLIPHSSAHELRLLFRQERLVADLEVLGAEAREAFVDLGLRQRRPLPQPADKLLVPARDQRRAVGDPLRSCV